MAKDEEGFVGFVGFGTLKSKVPDLRAMFSCCRRARRSLRFSFSEAAAWFFASKSASLSSSWNGGEGGRRAIV